MEDTQSGHAQEAGMGRGFCELKDLSVMFISLERYLGYLCHLATNSWSRMDGRWLSIHPFAPLLKHLEAAATEWAPGGAEQALCPEMPGLGRWRGEGYMGMGADAVSGQEVSQKSLK